MSELAQVETASSQANRNVSRALALSIMAGLAIAAGSGDSAPADTSARAAGIADCLPYFDLTTFRDHEYEVCSAYVGNSANLALRPFYQFGNNSVHSLAAANKHHFETRYWAGPRQVIEQEVASWPKTRSVGGNKVEHSINVVSVSSNLKADRGLLKTTESWEVTARGRVLHDEPEHTRDVTMCRGKLPGHFLKLPKHVLHEWFVVKYVRDPSFDCVAFDKRHGIKP